MQSRSKVEVFFRKWQRVSQNFIVDSRCEYDGKLQLISRLTVKTDY